MDESFRAEVHGEIGFLIVDNPAKRNAMSLAMYGAVPAAVEAVRGCRVVVLRGAGSEAFGAGSDIAEFAEKRTGASAATYNSVEAAATDAISGLPMPVIAMIHGPCRGGGTGLALSADLRFAADDATFAVPPARLGVGYPPDAVRHLVAAVGTSWAKDLIFTARVLDASEAQSIGLVHRVVPACDLEQTVLEIASEIAAFAPLTLAAAKAAIDGGDASELVRACFFSDDFAEGIVAFLEKRQPTFKGR